MKTYVEGYRDGWLEAIASITDLVLASYLSFLEAHHKCMDWYNVLLHEDDVPIMERPRLRVVDLPFTDGPEDDDDALAADSGIIIEKESA